MIRPGLNVVIDAQWGSTGKGKLGGWIGNNCEVDLACSSFGPNAGHTHVTDDGEKTVFKIMPMTGYTAKRPIAIMPDSVIDLERFYKECSELGDIPVYVHPLTAVLQASDAEAARSTGRHIAGTMQGTGHALTRKLLRLEGIKLAKDVLPSCYIEDTCQMVRDHCKAGKTVVFEISQGWDLSLNHGWQYPYVTSRDVSVATCINSAGVPPSCIASVIASVRTYPIRVGNVEGGYSGPHYPDQQELTWRQVAEECEGPEGLVEKTTVTGRVRRVFSFSSMQLTRFVEANDPDAIFINFMQYLDWNMHKVKDADGLTKAGKDFIRHVETLSSCPVWLVGTGAKESEMVVF